MTAKHLLLVSASKESTKQLIENGPKRDFVELARAVGGTIVYRPGETASRRWSGKLIGPHVRQAWQAARVADKTQPVFADGEHVGIPYALLRRALRRDLDVVFIAHFGSRWWKRLLFRLVTRLGGTGTVVVHSEVQRERLEGTMGGGWKLRLLPYQVDTSFWRSEPARPTGTPLVVAVGSENRDYETLLAAAGALGDSARFVIAAGSYWARVEQSAKSAPSNVEFLTEPLGFAELRSLYAKASAVVVPLQDVENQSGITTILEAMSMALPVVVTATAGQRECVAGPLVTSDGQQDRAATADRGPQLFHRGWESGATGLYVPVGDASALTAALKLLLADPENAVAMGREGRRTAEACFDTDNFIEAFSSLLLRGLPASVRSVPEVATP